MDLEAKRQLEAKLQAAADRKHQIDQARAQHAHLEVEHAKQVAHLHHEAQSPEHMKDTKLEQRLQQDMEAHEKRREELERARVEKLEREDERWREKVAGVRGTRVEEGRNFQ
ncbi:uncharacterized protein VTP21DRAFT_5703 [Calcarisporiella thermophila]|uniref:uncharacterized protein n=1 Tax=Calcarisporiella thermophila TaxID=911321 RepID=UPI0037420ACC